MQSNNMIHDPTYLQLLMLQMQQQKTNSNFDPMMTLYSNIIQQQQLQQQLFLHQLLLQNIEKESTLIQQNETQKAENIIDFEKMITKETEPEVSEISVLKRAATTEIECERAKRSCSSTHPSTAPSPSSSIQESVGTIKQKSSTNTSISDSECDEFIDVVNDPIAKTKAQRKAHIEFYRKLKLLRNREKVLQCNLCSESVENIENSIRAHITSHADASYLICKICGYSTGDLHAIFQHMSISHSDKYRNSYEDRRNMEHLSKLLSTCFPRTATNKQKNGIQDYIQKIVNQSKNKESEILCHKCNKTITISKENIIKHVHLHHVFKCKRCKHINDSEDDMKIHVKEFHEINETKIGSDYHISSATDAIITIFKKCFGKYME